MPRRDTFPYPPTEQEHWSGGRKRVSPPLPERPNLEYHTFFEALMQTVGKDEIPESLEERVPLREAIHRSVERLGEPGKSMIEAYFYEGIGYRGVERRTGISKSQAQRMMPEIVDQLRQLLLEEPLVRARVGYVQEESD